MSYGKQYGKSDYEIYILIPQCTYCFVNLIGPQSLLILVLPIHTANTDLCISRNETAAYLIFTFPP